jgi:hypothetical protein
MDVRTSSGGGDDGQTERRHVPRILASTTRLPAERPRGSVNRSPRWIANTTSSLSTAMLCARTGPEGRKFVTRVGFPFADTE